MIYPEQENPYRQKVDSPLPRVGIGRERRLKKVESDWSHENILKFIVMNILKSIELYTLNQLSIQNVNFITIKVLLKVNVQDIPGGSVVPNQPASVPLHVLGPWSWKIPHTMEELSLCSSSCPRAPEPVLHNNRSLRNEKPVNCNEEWCQLAAARESLCIATKTQCSQK